MKKLALFIFVLAIIACEKKAVKTTTDSDTSKNTSEITISKQQFESENMQLGSLTEHGFISAVKANGMIDVPPESRSSVSTFVGGYVNKIPLLIGDYVKKGQFVASLTNTEFVQIQQNYLEVAAQVDYLKNEFERQKTLFGEQISSEKNYLKAASAYKSNLAAYNGLRKKLEMLNINLTEVEKGNLTPTINLFAPIDGFITKVYVSNGTYVSAASELMEIENTKHIHLELNVFEKDILKVKKEQKILFKIPESSENYFDASVYLVGTTITNTRTVKVHGHIKDESQHFMTGMFVEATIIFKDDKKVALVNSAVISDNGQSFILIVKKQQNETFILEKKLVETGKKDEEFTQIINFEDFKDKKILIKGGFML